MADAYDQGAAPRDGEYPDDAGYPDGEGTLDEGTGAYRDGSSGDEASVVGPSGDEAADDGGRDDTGAEGEAVVDELLEFDGADDRDE